ncbi:MAG: PAS domain S-box protein, partial [Desulfobacterota bacterium]|nr:PAS domain S-box protein [Thermodesulfobacteriota bacterium]
MSLIQSRFISSFLKDTLNDAQTIASFLPAKALEEKNSTLIENHLKNCFALYPKFENGIFILDEKGDLLADYPPHPRIRGQNFSHREYFKTTMEKQRGIIGIPYRSARTGMPVVTFTALLKGARNQTLGLLGCSVMLLHPDAFGGIRRVRIGESGFLYVIEASSGRILVHPDDEKVFQLAAPISSPVSDEPSRFGADGLEEGLDSEGVPVVRSVRRIPETDWVLVVQQNKSEAFAPIYKTRTRIIFYTLIIVLISVVVSNLAIRRITDPLQRLRRLVKEVGEKGFSEVKDFDDRLASLSSSSDEIGEFVRALSEMAERLNRAHLSLREALEEWERTFNSVYDQIFILDRENRILRINRAASELIGIPPEEAKGQFCYRLIHGTDSPPPDCPHRETLATGKVVNKEVEEPHLDGFFEVMTVPQSDEAGKIKGTIHVMRNITRRKRAEMILKESEERYRTLVESARDVIFTISPDGRILSLNAAFDSITGWKREDWIGKPFRFLLHPEDEKWIMNFYEKALQGERFPSFELRFLHANGEYRYGEFTVSPLLKGGEVISLLGIARDVTQRKKDEAALRISEEKFSKTFRSSPVWLSLATLEEGRYLEVNEAFCRGSGYSYHEVIGKTSLELGLWPASEDRGAFVDELKAKGVIRNKEVRFRKRSGELVDVLLSAEVIEIEGKPYVLGAVLDISDRVKAEEALRASEEKYRSLVEYSSDAILLLNLERRILSCNEAFSRLFGYERHEIEGQSTRLIHPSEESYRLFGEVYYPLIRERGFFRTEYEVLHKNGERIPVEVVVSAIRSTEGEVKGYVAILRDMREKKRMEGEKAALEDQLRQSQKMEAIGILAGGVAHDFNNLLTVIQGNCELILFGLSEDHPLRKGIEQIREAARKASDLTRQLLAFSRRQILEPKVIDLNQIIMNLQKMLHRIIGEDIQLVTCLAEDLGRVKADPSQVEQVILNMAVNARDAMPAGGRLTIETSNVELDEHYARHHVSVVPGRYVMFSMTDTGVGMTPEVKERIFEPFFTTKEKGRGTGLGLSTVYGIVKQSKGYIWVYSEPGKGSTFKVYFPRVEEAAAEIEEKRPLFEIPRGKETVLLVEDDENVRVMTSRMLARFGYRVLLASDGPQAIRLFEKEKDS